MSHERRNIRYPTRIYVSFQSSSSWEFDPEESIRNVLQGSEDELIEAAVNACAENRSREDFFAEDVSLDEVDYVEAVVTCCTDCNDLADYCECEDDDEQEEEEPQQPQGVWTTT